MNEKNKTNEQSLEERFGEKRVGQKIKFVTLYSDYGGSVSTTYYDKALSKKFYEAESMLPGVDEQLKAYHNSTWDIHVKGEPIDVRCIQTDKYQIVCALWEEKAWTDYTEDGRSSGTWISLHYKERGSNDEIKSLKTEKREREGINLDNLWDYTLLDVKALNPSKVEVTRVDEEGNEGKKHQFDLYQKSQQENKNN